MTKYVVSVFLVVLSITQSSFGQLPLISSPLSEFSCQIVVENEAATNLVGHCSGTFVSPNLFVTAAHCLDNRYIGVMGNRFPKLKITCPGKPPISVNGTILHPNYYGQEQDFDIAGLIVQNTHITEVPQIPNSLKEQNDLLGANKCSTLSYSRYFCDSKTGKGCFRKIRYAKPVQNTPVFVKSQNQNFGKGDSGGGIICLDQENRPFLNAIHTQDFGAIKGTQYVDFITQLKDLSFQDLMAVAKKHGNGVEHDKYIESFWRATLALRKNVPGAEISCGLDIETECKSAIESILKCFNGSQKFKSELMDTKHNLNWIAIVGYRIERPSDWSNGFYVQSTVTPTELCPELK